MSIVSKVYNSILTKGLFSSLQTKAVENGKLRITTDTRQIFLDDDNQRKELSSFVKGMTEEQIRSQLAPLPKFYYSSDTNKLLYYDSTADDWVVINSANADYADSCINAFYATTAGQTEYSTTSGQSDHADAADFAEEGGTAISLEWGEF